MVSVKVARTAITQRQMASKIYSRITWPLPFDEIKLVLFDGSVIFYCGFKNSDDSQNHKSLRKDYQGALEVNLIEESGAETSSKSSKVKY